MKGAKQRGGWYLDPQLQNQWWQLEQALLLLYQVVLTLRPEFLHPINLMPFRLPSQWNYRKSHETERLARIRVLNSRNAFVPLIALCAYAISVSQGIASAERRSDLNWIYLLVSRYQVHPEWINEIIESPFFSLSAIRVGVYVDLENFDFPHILDHYIIYGVPVFIRIPTTVPTHIPRHLRVSSQDKVDIQTRRRRQLEQHQEQQQQHQQLLQGAATIPPIRVLPGETVHDFVQRNTSLNSRVALYESDFARIRRIERERRAVLFECPDEKGSYVFEWIEIDGEWRRTYVPGHNLHNVWASYTNSQRWYNSVRDEWDLCTLLDPNAAHSYDDFEDGQFDASLQHDMPDHTLDDIGSIIQTDIEHFYADVLPVSEAVSVPIIDDILYMRYGYHPDGNYFPQPDVMLDSSRAAKALVEDTLGIKAYQTAVTTFVSFLASPGSIGIPASLHDMHDDNMYALRAHLSKEIQIHIMGEEQFAISNSNNPEQVLQLRYPSSVLEALRMDANRSIEDIALHFVAQGTWCHIGQSPDTISPFHNFVGPKTGLGFRPVDFKPGWIDYQAYVSRRNELLKDPSVVRAALQMGGIIWRLTVDSIIDNYGKLEFSNFLTSDVEVIRLTNHDLGLIVGMYLVWTGNNVFIFIETLLIYYITGEGVMDKTSSWWPQHFQWQDSGIDVRYWSSSCETWFQRRIEALRNKGYTVRQGKEWGNSLKLFKETIRLVKRNEQISLKFIHSL